MDKLYYKKLIDTPRDVHMAYVMQNNGLEEKTPEAKEFSDICFQNGLVKVHADIVYFRPGLSNPFPDVDLAPDLAEKGWEYEPPK